MALLLACMPKLAIAQDAVIAHYRAYREALAQNNLVAAEHEATEALQASETRDGSGGRTAVLALNLATTRLSMGRGVDAVAPSHRARELAQANSASGVDPVLAVLVSTRADLAAGAVGASSNLRSELVQAQGRPDLVSDVYAGATDLGRWAIDHDHYDIARAAWEIAAHTAQGANIDPNLAQAYANIQLGRSVILASGRQHLSREDATATMVALNAAARQFYPFVRDGIPAAGPTAAQRTYAEAVAWRTALFAVVGSEHIRISWPTDEQEDEAEQSGPTELAVPEDSRPLCDMRLMAEPLPHYPSEASDHRMIGAAVLYVETAEDGSLPRHEVMAVVGPVFAGAVEAVVSHWRMVRLASSAPNCRMTTHGFRSVSFMLDN